MGYGFLTQEIWVLSKLVEIGLESQDRKTTSDCFKNVWC